MRKLLLASCLLLPIAAQAQSSSTIVPAAPAGGATITPAAPLAPPADTAAPPLLPGKALKPAPVSPEALAAAKALTDLLGIPAQAKAVLGQVRAQVIQATINASGKSLAEASSIADEVMMPDFQAKEQELADALVRPWALGFTPEELGQLREFYTSPLGKRLLATMPEVTRQSVAIGQQWMQQTFRDAVVKHADELKARGLKF